MLALFMSLMFWNWIYPQNNPAAPMSALPPKADINWRR
jgi:hypothetical protein